MEIEVLPNSGTETPAPTVAESRGPKRSVALSSIYSIGARLGMRAIGLVSTLILVRILSPRDFGIVALAQAVFPILDFLTSTGVNLAIIRMRDPEIAHYDTAWTIGVIRGLLIAVCLVAVSPLQASFMHEPRVEPLMWVIAANAAISSLANVRLIDFERNMRYDLITWWSLSGKLLGFAITMLLAVFFRAYWILPVANLIARIISVPAGYVVAPYRPRFSLAGWRDFFHFSKWLFLGNFCVLADRQLMNFLIGRYLGIAQVGLYGVVNQIAALPITELAAPVRGPLYSGLARISDDLIAFRRSFFAGFAAQCALVLPLTMGVVLTAPEIVGIFLGPAWKAAIPLLPIIAGYQLFDTVGYYVHLVLLIKDRQKLYTLTYYISVGVRIPVTIWSALQWGLLGASYAMFVTAAFNAIIWSAQVNRILQVGRWQELACCWRSILSAALMSVLVLVLATHLRANPQFSLLARFAAETAAGGFCYLGFHTLFWYLSGMPEASPEGVVARALQRFLLRPRVVQPISG